MNQFSSLNIDTPEALAEFYPKLFNKNGLEAWRGLFDEQAILVRTEKDQPYRILSLNDAMPEQVEYAQENSLFEEVWENVSIECHGEIAVISADYRLTTDHEVRSGVDVALLARSPALGWRIVSLAYQQRSLTQR